jgi:hypothetical protein
MVGEAHHSGALRKPMQTKLYVTNVSRSATLASVRQFFGACGDVMDVEFLTERNSQNSPSAAYVTMATSAGAERAIEKLHGKMLHDRTLMISHAPVDDQGGARSKQKGTPAEAKVAVRQQYREREGMAYELDCAGVPLIMRVFFPEPTGMARRVQARTGGNEVHLEEATAATPQLAFDAIVLAWGAAGPSAPELDWTAVATALKTVRGI